MVRSQLRRVLKTPALWSRKTGIVNENGQAITEKVSIKMKKEQKFVRVISGTGEAFVETSTIVTLEKIEVGDKIDNKPVASVNHIYDARNSFICSEVFLK